MRFTRREVQDLLISAVVIGFCFAWIQRNAFPWMNFVTLFGVMLVAVGSAFLLHELAHKSVAQGYGCWAEYRTWEAGLFIAFLLAVSVGFVFAAPGAVYISARRGFLSPRENGRISAAGPTANLLLAFAFLGLAGLGGLLSLVGSIGFFVNAWIALFNLLPFPPFDGSKIFAWDPRVWGLLALLSFLLLNAL
jgi:Zn-dependent protease